MVHAVANSVVPKFTVVIGGSFGAGQLRHVRPRLRPAPAVDVAQRAHLGDGRRAGGRRAGHGQARPARARGPAVHGRRRRRDPRARSSRSTTARAPPTTPRRGSGTMASSTRSTRGRRSRSACRRPTTRRFPTRSSACSGCSAMASSHLLSAATRAGRVRHAEPARTPQRVRRDDDRGADRVGASPRADDPRCAWPCSAGAGTASRPGADLNWMARMVDYSEEENRRDARALAEMFQALDTLPVPLVGRVHGAALGGGTGLAAVCDIVVAERGRAVRVHRGEARHPAGRDLALLRREDRRQSPRANCC